MALDPYQEVEQAGIALLYRDLPAPVQGLYYRVEGIPVIILARGLTTAEERCTLAEELGHHYLTVGENVGPYRSLRDSLRVGKEEERAFRWALQRLIDDEELEALLAHQLTAFELAEHFQVTEPFVQARLALRQTTRPARR